MKRTEKTLSGNYYKGYRLVVFGMLFLFMIGFIAVVIMNLKEKNWFVWLLVPVYGQLFYRSIQEYKKVFKSFQMVSYDHDNLYVNQGVYDIEIPLENVKEVMLKSIDGLYRFELFREEEFGKFIYCKPSMWYPFNYKKVDKELDWIRYLIGKKKKNLKEMPTNRLPSTS